MGMPFFIDWMECADPRDTCPLGGTLRSLSTTNRDATDLQRTLASREQTSHLPMI